ncbi:hypothetical protein ACSSS7_006785 [Eimeria intestinalis]
MNLFLPLLLALAAFCSKAAEAGPDNPTKTPPYVQCTGKDALILTFFARFERVCVRFPPLATVRYLQFALSSLAVETRDIQVRHRALWRRVFRRQNIDPETRLRSLAKKQLEASVLDGGARVALDTRFVFLLPRLDLNNMPLLNLETVSIRHTQETLIHATMHMEASKFFFQELGDRPFRGLTGATPAVLSKLFPNRTYSHVEVKNRELRLLKYMPSKVFSYPMKRSTYFCGAKIPYRISDLGMKQLRDAFASEDPGNKSVLDLIAARRPRSTDEEQDPTIVLVQFFKTSDGFTTMKETVIHVVPVEAELLHGQSPPGVSPGRAKPTFPESERSFKSLQEFFTRSINIEVLRPIDKNAHVVSPADSVIQNAFYIKPDENGEIQHARIPQVKGTTFNLSEFLFGRGTNRHIKLQSPENRLHVQIFYLSPADYHRFHSSADWKAIRHVYIPGCVPSVRRNVLLNRNVLDAFERTSVQGHWRPGNTAGPRLFFSMTFVAAMMVGGIELHYRQNLDSNNFTFTPSCASLRKSIVYEYHEPVPLCMGQEMGTFKFGSTVVLVFEAPKEFTASAPVCEHVDVSSTTGSIFGSPRRTLPRCDFTYGNHSDVVDYLKHLQRLRLQDAEEGLSATPSIGAPIVPHLQNTADANLKMGRHTAGISMLEQEIGDVTEGEGSGGLEAPDDDGGAGDGPVFDLQPQQAPHNEEDAILSPQPGDSLEPEIQQQELEDREPELPVPRGTEDAEAPLWWFVSPGPSSHRSVVRRVTGEEKPISFVPDLGAKIQTIESGLIRRYALARFLAAFWAQLQNSPSSSGGSVMVQLGQLDSGETDSNARKLPKCYFDESTHTVLLRFSGKKSTLLLMVPAGDDVGFFLRYPNFACASAKGWGKQTRGVRASWSVGNGVLSVTFTLSIAQKVGDQTASVGEMAYSFGATARPTPIVTPPAFKRVDEMDENWQQSEMQLGVNIRVRHFHLSGPQDIREGGVRHRLFTVTSGSQTFMIPQPSSTRHELTCPDSPFYRAASAVSSGIRRLPFFRRGQQQPELANWFIRKSEEIRFRRRDSNPGRAGESRVS